MSQSETPKGSIRPVEGLHPKELESRVRDVWSTFFELASIPYPNYDSDRFVEKLHEFADGLDLESTHDEMNNVYIRLPATIGLEDLKPIALQAHHDGVYVGRGDPSMGITEFTLGEDENGQYIKANGTSLTADNRLGLAEAMIVMDTLVTHKIPHGEIRLVVTAKEEIGMVGAGHMIKERSDFLNGNIVLVNVDSSSTPDFVTVGCASGARDTHTLDMSFESVDDMIPMTMRLEGFIGGHSGNDIGKNRLNPIKFFTQCYSEFSKRFPDARLASLNGGDKSNAIPQWTEFTIAVDPDDRQSVTDWFEAYLRQQKESSSMLPEETKSINIREMESKTDKLDVFSRDSTDELIHLLSDLPHGVFERSGDIVQCSTNLAVVRSGNRRVSVETMNRGVTDEARDKARDSVYSMSKRNGTTVEEGPSYPAWIPRQDNPYVGLTKEIYHDITGKQMSERISTGGLEPGFFEKGYPGLVGLSLAVTRISDEHSDSERAYPAGVPISFQLLLRLVQEIPFISGV